jgi:RNA polymerase sigma-70 factor, ECF subfamily
MRKGPSKTVTTPKPPTEPALFEVDMLDVPVANRRTLDQLFSVTYEELRRLASAVRRGDPSATLSPTALVNEAWLKLAKSPDIGATSRLHFKRIAARAMRQLLVEAARRRNADKRGGGAEMTVSFDDALKKSPSSEDELLPETAALLGVSEATVLRDWRAAKAWLANELRKVS